MKVSVEDIRRQYAELSDESLLEIERRDLIDQARQCYDEELARRQLKPSLPAPPDAVPFDTEDLEVAASYPALSEARLARDLLRENGVRAYLSEDFPAEAGRTLAAAYRDMPVMVPVSAVDAARELLQSQVPDEELAAKAIDASYIRHGVGAVRPYLYGKLDLLDFVQQVFGALELERHDFSPTAAHVEVMIGDSVVVMEVSDPPHAAGSPASVYVYVEDVDAAYGRALEAGAVSVAAPVDKPYQERSAGVKDSFGNTWWISTYQGA